MIKKYSFFILLFLFSIQLIAQERKHYKEKIISLKVAYLTNELQLTKTEAEKFWPIYNTHKDNLGILRNTGRSEIKKKLRDAGSLDKLEEKEAKKFVLLRLDLDKKIAIEKENFISKLSRFLSYKKIMKLHMSEREFAKKLMRKYGREKKHRE